MQLFYDQGFVFAVLTFVFGFVCFGWVEGCCLVLSLSPQGGVIRDVGRAFFDKGGALQSVGAGFL